MNEIGLSHIAAVLRGQHSFSLTPEEETSLARFVLFMGLTAGALIGLISL